MASRNQPSGAPESAATEAEPSAAHTPGPWVIGWSADNGAFHIEPHTGGSVICKRGPWSHKAGATLANARLIAAAPDLLAALRMCVQRIERPNLSPDANVVLERARAALDKVEAR